MKTSVEEILEEAERVAIEYGLRLIEIERLENIISLKLVIDKELFIQIYGNSEKEKINLALVFSNKRLYGFDSEGGKYHCHSFDDPDSHVFLNERKSVKEFARESLMLLEKRGFL
ncbi:MAG: hypothetical protein HZA01_00140 [Nitrospinae bacterium]|nr:hypothetical protein [Nitrospinota bacterium]